MKKLRPGLRPCLALSRSLTPAAVLLAAMSSAPVFATSDAWDGSTDAAWATSTNWLGDPALVPGAGEIATFNGAGNGNTTVDLGAGVTIGSVIFDTASAAAYTIGSGAVGSQTLTFGNAGAITVNAGVTTNQLFNSNLQLSSVAGATSIFANNGSGLLSIAGTVNANVISGNGLLTVTGSGNTSISGAITKTGAGSNALLKTGAGTLTLSNGSAWTGTGALGRIPTTAFGTSLVAREGTLLLNGGTHTATAEVVIGGVVADGGAGQNAKLQIDSGTLNITGAVTSGWLSVGRGNGVGVATSDLELNNAAVVTAGNFSAGFNGGSALNIPRGTITLNGTSSLSVNRNVRIAESVGSNFTLNVNGTSQFSQIDPTNVGGNETRVGENNGAVGVINVNGGTASFERDLILGYGGTGSGTLVLNSGVVNVANATERWLIINRAGAGSSTITVNGGTLNLNANTDLRFATTNTATGTNVVNLNGGAITGGVTSVVDLKQQTGAAGSNTFNLNGGTLTISQVISARDVATVRSALNFNGGTLRASTATANFVDLGGVLERANVRNGGALINSNGFNVTIPEALRHSDVGGDNAIDGGLTKSGLGTLTLTAATNTYTGPTTVNVGTVALGAASTLASTSYNIANGAEFDVSAKAAYALNGVTTTFGLDGSTGGFFDAGTAALDFTGGLVSLNFSTSALTDGQTYNLFDFGSQVGDLGGVSVSGSFSGSASRTGEIWSVADGAWAFSLDEGTGVLTVLAVPEPSTFAALAGLVGLGFAVGRRRRA